MPHHLLLSLPLHQDPSDLETTGGQLRNLSTTYGAGGVLDLYYPHWKLKINQNERLFSIVSQLWAATYAQCDEKSLFAHPYGAFDATRGYMYLDRVCYRVPDTIASMHASSGKGSRVLQRSLAPHWDCCPADQFGASESQQKHFRNKKTRRWRPIQSFVSLTDTLEANHGGFEAAPRFHKEFAEFAKKRGPEKTEEEWKKELGDEWHPPVCVGEFARVRAREDRDILGRLQHVALARGAAVFWDYRLPHANAAKHLGVDPRVVVYTGFLPDTQINRDFALHQSSFVRRREPLVDQWQKNQPPEKGKNVPVFPFSTLGRRLLALEPWPTPKPNPCDFSCSLSDGREIRPFDSSVDDVSQLSVLLTEAYGDLMASNKSVEKEISTALSDELPHIDTEYEKNGGAFFVLVNSKGAKEKGEIVGMIGVKRHILSEKKREKLAKKGLPLTEPTSASISRLVVSKKERRKGYGRALLEVAHSFSRSSGVVTMDVTTLDALTGAIQLYTSSPFSYSVVRQTSLPDGGSLVYMKADLNQSDAERNGGHTEEEKKENNDSAVSTSSSPASAISPTSLLQSPSWNNGSVVRFWNVGTGYTVDCLVFNEKPSGSVVSLATVERPFGE